MADNYESLLDRVCRASGVEREEVERRVEAKRAKLSGLVSKEGAAQIVAAELGISFDNERLKISELVHGMKKANVLGKVTKIFPVKEYNKNGKEGKIGSLLLGDESSNVRTVLWDTNHISLLEEGKIAEGDVIEIKNGNVRNGELHLSGFSDLRKSTEKLEGVKEEVVLESSSFADARPGNNTRTRAVIVQVFDPRYFESKQNGEKQALLNIVLDDGSEIMRAVLFGEQIKKLGVNDEEIFSLENFAAKKEEILGEEKFFSGTFRTNSFFNNIEMNVNGIEEVDANTLIQELENKS